MIGVGYIENFDKNVDIQDEIWNFRCFTAKSLSLADELSCIIDAFEYMSDIKQHYGYKRKLNTNDGVYLYHWGSADKTFFESARRRHNNLFDIPNMFDFNRVVTDTPILIKGVLNFKLKDYAAGMIKHGLIPNDYPDHECEDGMDAMIAAIDCYNSNNIYSDKFMDIIKYNEMDCKYVYHIINYIAYINV